MPCVLVHAAARRVTRQARTDQQALFDQRAVSEDPAVDAWVTGQEPGVTNVEPAGFGCPDPVAVCIDVLADPGPKT
jgi:hypothetical protein